MVQRYSYYGKEATSGPPLYRHWPSDDGPWVKYDDYAALQAQLDRVCGPPPKDFDEWWKREGKQRVLVADRRDFQRAYEAGRASIAEKLPKTADGVAVVPGMRVWFSRDSDKPWDSSFVIAGIDEDGPFKAIDGDYDFYLEHFDPSTVYSTAAAAQAAAERGE